MKADELLKAFTEDRTRAAEINGKTVFVKIMRKSEKMEASEKFREFTDRDMAEFLADKFTDEQGRQIFTADWFMSDDCTDVLAFELVQLFWDVNNCRYKKKQ
jgi:ssRNA-specific RNase YbeY (16S rRNA maturation enzyme)